MEATRAISPEDSRPDLRSQRPVELTKSLGPGQAQSQHLSPVTQVAQGAGAPADPDADQPMTAEALEKAVGQLRDHLQAMERSLKFSVDEDSGRTVIKVLDVETDEIIRQIPSEEALRILRHIAASGENGTGSSQGFFVREKA